VVNRSGMDSGQISLKKAQETIGKEIFWQLPNDYRTMIEVRNNGVPLIEQAPRANITQAVVALAEALTQDFPQRDASLALLARVHQFRGDITQAEALWKQAVTLNPKRSDLYESIGQAAQRKDQPDEAIAWWQKGL